VIVMAGITGQRVFADQGKYELELPAATAAHGANDSLRDQRMLPMLALAFTASDSPTLAYEPPALPLQAALHRVEPAAALSPPHFPWPAYCQAIDRIWSTYLSAGSTAEGFQRFKAAAAELKRRYVYGDSATTLTA
jgi:hypothetical protein